MLSRVNEGPSWLSGRQIQTHSQDQHSLLQCVFYISDPLIMLHSGAHTALMTLCVIFYKCCLFSGSSFGNWTKTHGSYHVKVYCYRSLRMTLSSSWRWQTEVEETDYQGSSHTDQFTSLNKAPQNLDKAHDGWTAEPVDRWGEAQSQGDIVANWAH